MIRFIMKFFLNLFLLIFFRIEIHGKENLPEGAYVLAPKHLSNWDPPILFAKSKRNDICILAKQELFINGFVKFLAKKINVLPVKRGANNSAVIKQSVGILNDGKMLLMFPEGTRKGIEKKQRIHSGAVVIANMANVPIVPVGIQATYKPFSKVIINYGKPIVLEDKKLDKDEIEIATNRLMEQIIELTNGDI